MQAIKAIFKSLAAIQAQAGNPWPKGDCEDGAVRSTFHTGILCLGGIDSSKNELDRDICGDFLKCHYRRYAFYGSANRVRRGLAQAKNQVRIGSIFVNGGASGNC